MSGWDSLIAGAPGQAVQGFEDQRALAAPEYDSPVFTLGLVQFSLPSTLHSLVCANNILVLAVIGHPRPPSSDRGGQAPQLILIDLARPTEVEHIELSIPPPKLARDGSLQSTLSRVFVDPTGRHVIVSTATGDNSYAYIGSLPPGSASSSRKARPLNRLKGAVIEAVSWNPAASTSTSSFATKEILLGTRNGQIIETVLLDPSLSESSAFSINVPGRSGSTEKYVKLLYTVAERQAVTGLRGETWGKRVAVIVTTQTRIYQFIASLSGGRRGDEDAAGMFEQVFQPYLSGEVQPKSLELPGEPTNSELHFFAHSRIGNDKLPTSLSLPKTVAWLTGPGIYHGTLAFPSPSSDQLHPGDGIIESASLIPYPTESVSPSPKQRNQFQQDGNGNGTEGRTEVPLSMALTEWHFILLYEDKIRVIEILSDRVVFEEKLDLRPNELPIQISTDLLRKTCWLYTDQCIFELVINNEDREVWKIYLNRSNWSEALRYAKTPAQRVLINTSIADFYFQEEKYIQSAQHYAKSSKSFESVVLRFVDKNERDALRYYLVMRLERLRKSDLTQRMMLATWLIEIYLSKINQLEDFEAATKVVDEIETYGIEKAMITDDLRVFLVTYKENLDSATVFSLLNSHGRDEMVLHYARVIGDHERIVNYWIAAGEWNKALVAIGSQEDLRMYYQFAPVLIKKSPKLCVETFLKQPDLEMRRLIPAFSIPQSPSSTPQSDAALETSREIVKYLKYSILQLGNTDTAVHNTLLTLYACSPSFSDEEELLSFLNVSPDNPLTLAPCYDLDFALRLFKARRKLKACGLIYAKMGLWEIAIDFALGTYAVDNKGGSEEADGSEDLELAKILADKPYDDDVLRKKLWLKVAKFVVGKKNDITSAMAFLSESPLLQIEDILPFFPPFTTIDTFKTPILTALEEYSSKISTLKAELDEAEISKQVIKRDIEGLRERFVVVEPGEKCRVCEQALLTRGFYAFPCQHCFHADCLIREVTKNLSPMALRRMLELQSQLSPAWTTTLASSRRSPDSAETNLISTRKFANASVQGLDQLRKLVLPDKLISIIGDVLPSSTVKFNSLSKAPSEEKRPSKMNKKETEQLEKMRKALDDLVAGSCILCSGAVGNIDKGFVEEGETM